MLEAMGLWNSSWPPITTPGAGGWGEVLASPQKMPKDFRNSHTPTYPSKNQRRRFHHVQWACEKLPSWQISLIMPCLTRNIRAHTPLQRNFQSLFGKKMQNQGGMDACFEERVLPVDCTVTYDFNHPDIFQDDHGWSDATPATPVCLNDLVESYPPVSCIISYNISPMWLVKNQCSTMVVSGGSNRGAWKPSWIHF